MQNKTKTETDIKLKPFNTKDELTTTTTTAATKASNQKQITYPSSIYFPSHRYQKWF